MKAFLYMMALSLSLIPLAGCETLTETPGENFTRLVHTTSTNVRQIPIDTERLFLLDHPSWMAKEPVPNE